MIFFQVRLFGFIFELVWVWGLLLGCSTGEKVFALNLGPFALLIFPDEGRTVCEQCLRPLKWGLHGSVGKVKLCRRREPPLDDLFGRGAKM